MRAQVEVAASRSARRPSPSAARMPEAGKGGRLGREDGEMRLRRRSLGVAFCLLLAGCAALSRQEAVPVAMEERATVLGTPGLRYWAGRDPADFVADAKAAYDRELATWRAAGNQGP